MDKKIDVPFVSERLHLRGRADEVLFYADGTAGPLDYKFARDPGRVYKTLRLQSAVYALLIRERFGVPVGRGHVIYARSANRCVEIHYEPDDFQEVGRAVAAMFAIVGHGHFPGRPPPTHCADCCYRRICV